MTIADTKDPRMLKPVLTADGRKWVQACFCCGKTVNFIKDADVSYLVLGSLVRHKRCRPVPIR